MDCITLTGISKQVIKELFANKVRTVEIRSPQNFFSLQHASPGEAVFLTEASATDIVPGTNGLITRANSIQTVTHRMIQSGEFYYEEIEAQASRAQLQLVGIGRVRSIKSFDIGEPFVLEVDQIRYCDAR